MIPWIGAFPPDGIGGSFFSMSKNSTPQRPTGRADVRIEPSVRPFGVGSLGVAGLRWVVGCLLALGGWVMPSAAAAPGPDFSRAVRPILAAKCYSCHGPDAEARKSGLRLDTFDGATSALKSGVVAIVPGKPAASALLARVTHADLDERMPPKGEPLTPAEVQTLEQWIQAGAAYAEPWAFRPLQDPGVPTVRDGAWCETGIDAFVLAHREAAGLRAPVRDVDPAALLRRLSYDLRGLPPTPEEVRSFVADPDPGRLARQVDRYLADAAFGERWGRHWLDLARFAETMAHEFDYEIPHAWRYRDYVVEAFNADVAPARFVAEQIAGDLLPPRPGLGLPNAAPLGTAWWFLGPATHSPVDVRQDEADRLAGAVDVAGRSLFGLSIACSRCHDHKFDPIPARDFYALFGVARNTRRIEGFLDADARTPARAAAAREALEEAGRHSGVVASTRPVSPSGVVVLDDVARGGAAWSRSGRAFDASGSLLALDASGGLRPAETGTLDSARLALPLAGSARSADVPISKRYFHLRLRGSDAAFRAVVDNYWLDKHASLLFEGFRRRLPRAEGAEAAKDPRDVAWRIETFDFSRYQSERVHFEVQDDGPGWIEVDTILMTDTATPPPAEAWDADGPATGWNPSTPGLAEARARAVEAREALLACAPPIRALLADEGGSLDEPIHVRGAAHRYGEPAPLARLSVLGLDARQPVAGSGRRMLVEALTDPRRPFLWRTTANRIWLKLFGRGIVDTPDDFGQLGGVPWSPELLDHLASRLAQGQTFKQLLRDLVLSHAYRSAADPSDPGRSSADAWSPMPARRLDAEQIRDAMLAASGTLDRTLGGASVPARLTEHMQGRGRPGKSGPVDGARRRSVYVETRRNFLDPFLQAFDQPAPATTCGRRHASNVPAQALALMNSELVHLMAGRWAETLIPPSDGPPLPTPAADRERIERLWLSAFARGPKEDEVRLALGFLADERASASDQPPVARERAAYAALAHALFASKEFVFLR